MNTIKSTGIVLNIENIDTDQIIPAKFLKATSREGFGDHLFSNWRYQENGETNPDFAFEKFKKGSQVLIAGNNFGCGSSREHAAWAIHDYGIRAIISSQFADIFKGNALNNNIIPIELQASEVSQIMEQIENDSTTSITVNIEEQTLNVSSGEYALNTQFEIDSLKKKFILEETNDLEYLISMKPEIKEFEVK